MSRTRWPTVKLAVVGALALGLTALTSLAFTWWSSSRDRLGSRLTPDAFNQRGIVPIAYVAFALVAGVAIGSVVRRVRPPWHSPCSSWSSRCSRPDMDPPAPLRARRAALPDLHLLRRRSARPHRHRPRLDALQQDPRRPGPRAQPSRELSTYGPRSSASSRPARSRAPMPNACSTTADNGSARRRRQTPPRRPLLAMQAAEAALFAAATLPLLAFCFWKLRRAPVNGSRSTPSVGGRPPQADHAAGGRRRPTVQRCDQDRATASDAGRRSSGSYGSEGQLDGCSRCSSR